MWLTNAVVQVDTLMKYKGTKISRIFKFGPLIKLRKKEALDKAESKSMLQKWKGRKFEGCGISYIEEMIFLSALKLSLIEIKTQTNQRSLYKRMQDMLISTCCFLFQEKLNSIIQVCQSDLFTQVLINTIVYFDIFVHSSILKFIFLLFRKYCYYIEIPLIFIY